jgi:hypothetical protein
MNTFTMVAAALIGVVSVARLTRLITQDSYPPVAWLRSKWQAITHDGDWSELATCPYCAAPYIAAVVLAWGLLTDFQTAWWVVNGWLAASYLASMVVVRDGE